MKPHYSELNKSVETGDVESQSEKPKKKCDKYNSFHVISIMVISWLLICILILIVIPFIVNKYNEKIQQESFDYLKNTTRRQLHPVYDHHPCRHYKYGCCDIYENTNGQIKVHMFDGHINHIRKHDKEGSNCPTLLHIAHEHNLHYANQNSCLNKNKTDECCKINVETDFRHRYNIHNMSVNQYYTNFPLIDGINCPSIVDLLVEYSENYPCKQRYMYCFWSDENILLFLCSLAGLCLCIGYIKYVCSKNK